MFKLFSENRVPVRGYATQTVSLYLFNIVADEDGEFSVAVRCAARQLNTLIEQAKHDGVLADGRMEEAITDTFNRHSARSAVRIRWVSKRKT
ncbi:hypothetical protein [Caballeronia novacaledonica]|uniref:Uncharacterized protein n=1 Tax=Caballeronia novacaledonica TaxID=1544861 RepID=A0AA37IM84_9BURK|nr:hypothetical protein [Caballeronia novacaledonica]GJH28925.1 hypothetical protein CBA19CS42_30435 [Caballeronia novacaledonica]